MLACLKITTKYYKFLDYWWKICVFYSFFPGGERPLEGGGGQGGFLKIPKRAPPPTRPPPSEGMFMAGPWINCWNEFQGVEFAEEGRGTAKQPVAPPVVENGSVQNGHKEEDDLDIDDI